MFRQYCKQFSLSIALMLSAYIAPTYAAELFADGFEDGVFASQSSTIWGWQSAYTPNNLFGMMAGENDIYSAYKFNLANSGSGVMRLRFDGRNGWCNACGSSTKKITSAELASGCVAISGAPWGEYVYNKDRGFSRWKITSETNSQVCFDKNSADANSLFGDNTFSAGDEIKIVKKCGVNGIVGGNINRRSDCDLAINYLENIQSSHFNYGEKLARRMYIYIPSATQLPNVGLKLGYSNFKSPASNRDVSIIPVLSVQRGSRLEVSGNAIFGFKQTDLFFEREKWYYLEEVFQRESSLDASNGSYKLYAGEVNSSDDLTKPILTITSLAFGPVSKFSIIGNWQHNNDATGSIYLDDVAIANRYIGPVNGISRPNPPTLFIKITGLDSE